MDEGETIKQPQIEKEQLEREIELLKSYIKVIPLSRITKKEAP